MGEHSLLVDDSYWTHQRLRHNRAATSDPTVDDDATIGATGGYGVGSLWVNTSTGAAWICVDATIGAAVWKDWQTYLLESDLWEWWHNIAMAGRLYGGAITDNGDGSVAVAAGGGIIKADEAGPEDGPASINAGQASVLSNVTWDAVATLALTDDAYNYIYYDGSAGVIAATTNFYAISFTRDFTLGRVYRDGTTVTIRLCGTNTWNFNRRVQLFGEEVFPVVKATGLIPSESGTRGIAVTAGVLWAELVNRFSIDAIDTAGTDSFTVWYRDGGGGWTTVATQTQVDNTNWDDGTGTLNDLTANRYGVHWVYVVHDNSLHVVYGQGDYLLAQAGEAAPPATLPGLLAAYATLIGKIIVQKSATNFTSIEAPSEISFTPTSVTDHGGLAGLADDDHPHYLLDKASGGVAIEVPAHTHEDADDAGTVSHDVLTDVSADDHHAQSHAHDGVDGSGTVSHGDLTDVGASDHHARYADAEAVTAMGAKDDANPLHHDRYTDAEAVSAVGPHLTLGTTPSTQAFGDAAAGGAASDAAKTDHKHAMMADPTAGYGDIVTSDAADFEAAGAVSTHAGDASAHHARYADAEAVSAMGAKGDSNPLNHDRYTDAAAAAAAAGVKLDDFAAPDDNTDLNATTLVHGLLPKLGGGSTNYLRADGTWATPPGTGGGGAPTTVDYLVGTASGDLSAEIVVGTTPGGELGGTWASPTVDATHSGSTHAATQAAAEATAAGALASHVSAADPHTGYRLESADHTHQSTGAQAGKLDHGAALNGLTDDDHTQYLLASGARDVAGDLLPDGDNTRDLGSSTDSWAEIWVDNVFPASDKSSTTIGNLSNIWHNAYIENLKCDGNIYIYPNNTVRMQFGDTAFLPSVDSTTDLGTDAKRWRNVYADAITGLPVPVVRPYPYASYTSGATWTKPSGLSHIVVECIGGGGGGGGAVATGSGQSSGGSGGGGGSYAKKLFAASALPATCTVTPGQPGTGGIPALATAPGNGSASTFAGSGITTVSGGGGTAGSESSATSSNYTTRGGDGGAATGGDINAVGSSGFQVRIISGVLAATGNGGAAAGLGGGGGYAAINNDGGDGGDYGGGGGGGGRNGSGASQAGGTGGDGLVIVTEYYQ